MATLEINESLSEHQYRRSVGVVKKSMEGISMGIACRVLNDLMNFRRTPPDAKSCASMNCPQCTSLYLPQLHSAIINYQPIQFVLPAFPGKSPNPEKVLSHLPDFAEQLSLQFLGNLCEQIKVYYPPGIKIILCSDGRVFSDIVGMKESSVSAYQMELIHFIQELNLTNISIFTLDDVYEDLSFSQMRDELMKTYGNSLELLQYKVRMGMKKSASAEEQEANRMYCGITRFLLEDSLYSGQTKSKTKIQKESRARAYEVIQRSNAWSNLIEQRFPKAFRLSIHPQTCGSKKFGIRLIGNESWMTPWHGVVVETNSGFILRKRSQAEAMGAHLVVNAQGRPTHYQLYSKENIFEERNNL